MWLIETPSSGQRANECHLNSISALPAPSVLAHAHAGCSGDVIMFTRTTASSYYYYYYCSVCVRNNVRATVRERRRHCTGVRMHNH